MWRNCESVPEISPPNRHDFMEGKIAVHQTEKNSRTQELQKAHDFTEEKIFLCLEEYFQNFIGDERKWEETSTVHEMFQNIL